MPLYEYKCSACGNVDEVIESFSNSEKHPCNSCGGEMSRIFSTFAAADARPKSTGGSSCATGTCPFA